MSELQRIILSDYCYFITTVVKDRKEFLLNETICSLILEDLEFYRKKYKFGLHGYIIMPDHIHLLISMGENGNISKFVGGAGSSSYGVCDKFVGRAPLPDRQKRI